MKREEEIMALDYRYGNQIDLAEYIELYRASTLGLRRPVDDQQAMRAMLENADLVVSAWDGNALVGIARTLTDFSYVAYLADLAVHLKYQKQGIGRHLIALTRRKLGPKSKIVLLAAPAATEYYPKIGFTRHQSAWTLDADDMFEDNFESR
jgi:predicted N-acetyltransferase YhbS